ncbi:uncharacterized protein LOC131594406 isoform X1 [Vicia villosa]|uniref:uncharacterized protein LOC131594406 isoform X1 n=1 Tax=Vicia villosa TaxID=3911 RepID=UPI00273C2AA4|nr:uncharacterized protein LOC131594406 isoform X1 [Vicia villosa]
MSPSYITKGHDVVKPTNHRQRPLRLLENHRESISLNHSESLSLRITVKATTVTSNFNRILRASGRKSAPSVRKKVWLQLQDCLFREVNQMLRLLPVRLFLNSNFLLYQCWLGLSSSSFLSLRRCSCLFSLSMWLLENQ